jgi:hypothetical protein
MVARTALRRSLRGGSLTNQNCPSTSRLGRWLWILGAFATLDARCHGNVGGSLGEPDRTRHRHGARRLAGEASSSRGLRLWADSQQAAPKRTVTPTGSGSRAS